MPLARQQNNQALLSLFNTAQDKINYLPCTPEVGLIDMLEVQAMQNAEIMARLNSMFAGHHLGLNNLIQAADYLLLNKAKPRDKAKDRLANLVGKISATTGSDEIHVRRTMYNEYVKLKYEQNPGELKAALGPLFNMR